MDRLSSSNWTVAEACHHYGINRWGDGYFDIAENGNVLVRPSRDPSESIDLKMLVNRLADRGLETPILIRFNGILRDRLKRINDCFQEAIAQYDYANGYRCIYPIKVNQQREVVQEIVQASRELGVGIEAGSKPELVAAVAMGDPGVPLVCNGFKDDPFIRLAMHARRFGREVLPVVEKASEIDLILRIASEVGVRPSFGIRVKLATRGSGRWQASGGYRSKFGLTVAEILQQIDGLIDRGMGDCLKLLHFHVGSQISSIRQLKSAILEAARIYVDLKRRGAVMGILDVGGGLGVDYDGTRSDSDSSMDYSLQEYANDVVFHVQSVCAEAGVEPPELYSESGRAITAQHSVLVMETLGVASQGTTMMPGWVQSQSGPPEDYETPVHDLWHAYQELGPTNMRETFHDAQSALDLCMNLFSGGYLPLEQRVAAESLYFAICDRVQVLTRDMPEIPAEFEQLDRMLSDIYFVNFSLFQSMPDAWAINHKFPIMPIHRLHEEPVRHAVLGDITCDSDGKVEGFVCGGDHRPTVLLHPLIPGQSYHVAAFLVGAYQEILGDLHNLFGDTHAVHVDFENGSPKIQSIVKGDTVTEVLGYVQFEHRELVQKIQHAVEHALGENRISDHQAGQTVELYESMLGGYTYLRSSGTPDQMIEDVPANSAHGQRG